MQPCIKCETTRNLQAIPFIQEAITCKIYYAHCLKLMRPKCWVIFLCYVLYICVHMQFDAGCFMQLVLTTDFLPKLILLTGAQTFSSSGKIHCFQQYWCMLRRPIYLFLMIMTWIVRMLYNISCMHIIMYMHGYVVNIFLSACAFVYDK